MLHVAEKLALNFQLINERIGLFGVIATPVWGRLGRKIIKLSFRFE